MRKSLFAVVSASAILASVGLASAQTTTTTTTTWTPQEGSAITQYSTTQHFQPYSDPALQPSVGAVLPPAVTVYPLPPTVSVPSPDQYSYSIVNNQPVVVERSTRRVVHVW